ncbi:hypothetical protein [Seonamhaeicola marinus]|uniref:Uncharacterized protein n=1 Tax=Seonamhaeicola marinus TaxID=1912246 RepID=A0A5D0HW04_9FLAO|nr:hypothetical protein [Seonamhaeicola marinus]TYA75010.1 hypothetical protein FUA24_17060 [Seonamhaeicola marinus]
MFGFVQKIILSIITLGIAGLFLFACYFLFIEESRGVNFNNIFPILLAVFGSVSFVFHLKTIRFYKTQSLQNLNFDNHKVFWGLNLAFIITLVLLAIFFIYQFSTMYAGQPYNMEEDMLLGFFIVILVPVLVSVWLFLDIRFLYRNKLRLERKEKLDAIDNIKGTRNS